MTNRLPKLQSDDTWLTKDEPNPVARNPKLKDAIDAAYGGSMPLRDSFSHSEVADVYISERTNQLDEAFEDDDKLEFLYERFLHRQFWDEERGRRFVLLIGAVGTGKTTLLGYYLRCYCPRFNREKFREKLCLYVDAKGLQKPEQLEEMLDTSLRISILAKCKDREFDIDTHLQENGMYRTEDHEWVVAALRLISDLALENSADAPFKYIVLTIDNVDQTPVEVQQRALVKCRDFLDDRLGIRFWRIYLPMWPETLNRIEGYLGMSYKSEQQLVQLGPLSGFKVRQGRQSRAESLIGKSKVDWIADNDDDGGSGLATQDDILHYVRNVCEWIVSAFEAKLDDIFFDDARRQLHVMWNVLRSKSAWRAWRNADKTGGVLHASDEMIPYALIDSALTGSHRAFNSNASQITNVYGLSQYTLLQGLHFLSLLDSFKGGGLTRQRAEGVMAILGHREFEFKQVAFSFLGANLYHERAGDGKGVDHLVEYVVHGKAISAYLWLAEQPAYVDNCAIVSPVPADCAGRIHRTSSLKKDDFRPRTETSIEFIRQLRADELQFFNEFSSLKRDADLSHFLTSFMEHSQLALPFFWKRLAVRYEERLLKLRKSWRAGRSLKGAAGVDEEWWSRILNDSMFKDAKAGSLWILQKKE
ncbi:MAG: hypothetical protein AABP62_12405 [Planctomycetota bacterium]